jgi:hypothetical protein
MHQRRNIEIRKEKTFLNYQKGSGDTSYTSPSYIPNHFRRARKLLDKYLVALLYPSDEENIEHIDYEHPGKLYYPTQEEKRSLNRPS